MTNPTRERLASLDGLRAASIALVILSHATTRNAPAYAQIYQPYFDGMLGVRIFFVISGFIITALLLREQAMTGRIALSKFYFRRILRLFPVQFAYICVLSMLMLCTALYVSPCQFLTALTYTKNYACSGWIDGHLWSLSVEEQFYLIWPAALVLLPRRWAVAFAAALIGAAPFSRAIEYRLDIRAYGWLTSNTDALMVGCLTACVFGGAWIRRLVAYRPAFGRIAALAVLSAPEILENHLMMGYLTVTLGPLLQAVCVSYLICSLVLIERGLSYRILNARSVIFLGKVSYSLYIWQQIFFTNPVEFGVVEAVVLTFPVNVAAALGTAVVSYLVLEKPVSRLRGSLARYTSPVSMGTRGPE